MNKLGGLDWLALILLVIGGLNWGLVGIFNIDLVSVIFGDMTTLARIIYVIVGLSAVYVLLILGKLRKE